MNRYASLVLAAACLLACSEELPCRTEGAVRANGVCGCPDGTRYVSDRAAKIDRCVTEGSGSATVGDSGSSTAEAGTGAAFDGGGHADSTKPDRAIDVASEADGQASDVLPSEAGTLAPGDAGGGALPGDSCAPGGALRCAMPGATARQRCVEGRWSSAESCGSAQPLCTGDGRCVQCTQTSECPAAGECTVALCDASTGTCGTTFKAIGSPCSLDICDGKRACGAAPTCGDV